MSNETGEVESEYDTTIMQATTENKTTKVNILTRKINDIQRIMLKDNCKLNRQTDCVRR